MANYWVAPPPAGNDANPGTQLLPWATPQHAADTAVAGDVVTFKDGTYNQAVDVDIDTNSGTPGNPITFQAENSRLAIWKKTANNNRLVDINNVGYITFDGLVFDGDQTAGGWTQTYIVRLDNVDNIIISDCVAQDAQAWGIYFRANGCTNCTVEDSVVNPGHYFDGGTYDGIAFYDSGNDTILIDNCTIYEVDHCGINIQGGDNITIKNCDIYDTHSHCIVFNDNESQGWSINNLIIHNNTLHDDGVWGGVHGSPQTVFGDDSNVETVYIYRNDVYGGAGDGIQIESPVTGPIYIWNNTVYDYGGSGADDAGIYLWSPDANTPTVEVKNNIIYNTKNGYRTFHVHGAIGTNLSADYNLYYADFAAGEEIRRGGVTYNTYADYQTAGYEPNTVIDDDPDLNNPGAADFTLQAGSPAIDAGVDVGLPYQGTDPDIGAHEYETIPPSVTVHAATALAVSSPCTRIGGRRQ